jgi:hypothetical protein
LQPSGCDLLDKKATFGWLFLFLLAFQTLRTPFVHRKIFTVGFGTNVRQRTATSVFAS